MRHFYFTLFVFVLLFISACNNETSMTTKEIERDQEVEISAELNDEENNLEQEEERLDIDIVSDDSITVLVNKFNSLSDSYTPEDLVTVSVPTVLENPEVNQLRQEASNALTKMFAKAEEEGHFLFARSGFRSYDTQIHLFDSYAERHGEEEANKYSAKPGYSEHQTGLVMDITSESVQFELTEHFGETPEGIWVKENAHKFGFIIRYPKNKEDITGYIYEPWHLRYLGKEVATLLYKEDLTFEEFLVKEGYLDNVKAKK